jgi:hypothetical protein
MSEYLNFYFSTKDPNFKTFAIEVPNTIPNNRVEHAFVSTPIYDNFDVEIGYKCSDDYIQQVSEDKYLVRINNTYYINGKGTISWQYAFLNDKPSYFYPVGILAASNITSTTGDYFGKTGAVTLLPTEDGKRSVTIGFNFN